MLSVQDICEIIGSTVILGGVGVRYLTGKVRAIVHEAIAPLHEKNAVQDIRLDHLEDDRQVLYSVKNGQNH
jgi:hypothetical protein